MPAKTNFRCLDDAWRIVCDAESNLNKSQTMPTRDNSPKRSASESNVSDRVVYVIMQNQDYEGGSVLHICWRKEDAEAYAKAYAERHSTPHRQYEEVKGGWKCGQTRIEVEEWSVH